ncbi:hypothetical protein [Burkholderia ubonensis]|uniref:hypothetical protein n=1 Tax=Burkholderia ubonensis TaxID=101571 RepID=UPI0007549CF0|nr:hypothetical protein [Burkholderia ubonensis]KVW77431.1 hypothetical protein WK99_27950 [Burkholderia ubonensis]
MNEKTESKLLEHLECAAASLKSIALLRAVDAFYTREEYMELLCQYRALLANDLAAYGEVQRVREADPDRGIGWEERIEKYGEEEANKRNAPFNAAFDAKKATSDKVRDFERVNPLIVSLHRLNPSAM